MITSLLWAITSMNHLIHPFYVTAKLDPREYFVEYSSKFLSMFSPSVRGLLYQSRFSSVDPYYGFCLPLLIIILMREIFLVSVRGSLHGSHLGGGKKKGKKSKRVVMYYWWYVRREALPMMDAVFRHGDAAMYQSTVFPPARSLVLHAVAVVKSPSPH